MQLQVLACCFFINPATSGVFPDCPACGGMSGTYSLLHMDVAAAIRAPMLHQCATARFLPADTGISVMVGFTMVLNVILYLGSGLGS